MAGKRLEPHNDFMQFLLDNHRDVDSKPLCLTRISELAESTGKSRQLLQKYNDHGLDDLGKRLELVKLCRIDISQFLDWLSQEIRSRAS